MVGIEIKGELDVPSNKAGLERIESAIKKDPKLAQEVSQFCGKIENIREQYSSNFPAASQETQRLLVNNPKTNALEQTLRDIVNQGGGVPSALGAPIKQQVGVTMEPVKESVPRSREGLVYAVDVCALKPSATPPEAKPQGKGGQAVR
ncbi:MAG: hypothetical protein ACK52W_01420 [Alphaproteobacteria bacterium]